jgi:acyl-CoA thioester hydrolase
MTERLSPPTGTIEGGLHRLPVRVYYEDTDASGIVYHANYLRYMERARSEIMRLIGFDQQAMLALPEDARVFFAIRALAMEFLRPARLDDVLEVRTWTTEAKGASGRMVQSIWRGDEQLIDAQVRAAFLGGDGKPRRLPETLRAAMVALHGLGREA